MSSKYLFPRRSRQLHPNRGWPTFQYRCQRCSPPKLSTFVLFGQWHVKLVHPVSRWAQMSDNYGKSCLCRWRSLLCWNFVRSAWLLSRLQRLCQFFGNLHRWTILERIKLSIVPQRSNMHPQRNSPGCHLGILLTHRSQH